MSRQVHDRSHSERHRPHRERQFLVEAARLRARADSMRGDSEAVQQERLRLLAQASDLHAKWRGDGEGADS